MNNEWITDRSPTRDDGVNGLVYNSNGDAVLYTTIHIGDAWKPIPKCEPYVKPKRWFVVWSELFGGWSLREIKGGGCVQLFDPIMRCGLVNNDDEHREAAERIAAIYNEVMP